jgi:hypothetical protein
VHKGIKMISQLQKSTCEEFVTTFFATKNTYSKFDSPGNRPIIVDRVTSFGISYPSATAVKRACLELLDEGLIDRTDGKDSADDALDAKQEAEEADRQTALEKPLTQMDASLYASLSWPEICERCKNDRVFRYRYEAACRLFGFRFPQGLTATVEETPDDPSIPKTAEQYHAIPVRTTQIRYQREPRFRAAVTSLISQGLI